MIRWIVGALTLMATATVSGQSPDPFRVATFNASLNFPAQGDLVRELEDGSLLRARKVAAVIQRVRPDLILINEFDHDMEGVGARLFMDRFLAVGQFGESAIDYSHHYTGPVNTGVSTGVDLDGDGMVAAPRDAHGWGEFPGQYGMLVLSRFPIDRDRVRTFQHFLWRQMPEPWWPVDPETGQPYYSEEAQAVLRLSSKSHWDLPIRIHGRTVHFLVSHPTPPVFDGPEDRNGRRNHDEIRFWRDYVTPLDYPVDDAGQRGGLSTDSLFVIAGDLNADPHAGASSGQPATALLAHPRVDDSEPPASEGAARAGPGDEHAANDTADFAEDGAGNLRVDYVLPSVGFQRLGGGVFWPPPGEAGHDWIDASDHHLVWLDLGL